MLSAIFSMLAGGLFSSFEMYSTDLSPYISRNLATSAWDHRPRRGRFDWSPPHLDPRTSSS
jgi:hypothetical protein